MKNILLIFTNINLLLYISKYNNSLLYLVSICFYMLIIKIINQKNRLNYREISFMIITLSPVCYEITRDLIVKDTCTMMFTGILF